MTNSTDNVGTDNVGTETTNNYDETAGNPAPLRPRSNAFHQYFRATLISAFPQEPNLQGGTVDQIQSPSLSPGGD